jgi:hypothetical protein
MQIRVERLESLFQRVWIMASTRIPSLILFGNSGVASTTTTRFLTSGFDSITAPTVAIQFRIPIGGTLRNMRIHVRAGAGNGNLIVYTLRVNSIATALTVSMASTATDGSNLVAAVGVNAGDLIDIQVTKALNVGAAPSDIMCSIQFL